MSDVVVIRRSSEVTFVRGQPSAPVIRQELLPSVIIQRNGIRGLPGVNGDGATFQHDQTSPANEWIVNHNLGAYPSSVSVIFAGGQEVEADIRHFSTNQLRIYFDQPQTGLARVSP